MASEPQPTLDGVRPLVAMRSGSRGVWLFAGALGIAAVGLFSALEARRGAITAPRTAIGGEVMAGRPGAAIEPVPSLVIPGPAWYPPDPLPPRHVALGRSAEVEYPTLPGVPRSPRVQAPRYLPGPPTAPAPVYYSGAPGYAPPAEAPAAPPEAEVPGTARVRATRFANPATTVPQGTVIQAVLETALDSNRPGFARAIVSRDVRGFDGTRVLIPRGSRLFGEYKADLADGQNRALVQWLRLTRPDGVQIAIDSPSADALGRAGVRGKVDSHFFQRFSGAILQSALDIGVNLATRSASNDTVVVGLPGSSQNLVAPQNAPVRPTLRVRHGTSASVFVGRDLDFSTVEP